MQLEVYGKRSKKASLVESPDTVLCIVLEKETPSRVGVTQGTQQQGHHSIGATHRGYAQPRLQPVQYLLNKPLKKPPFWLESAIKGEKQKVSIKQRQSSA